MLKDYLYCTSVLQSTLGDTGNLIPLDSSEGRTDLFAWGAKRTCAHHTVAPSSEPRHRAGAIVGFNWVAIDRTLRQGWSPLSSHLPVVTKLKCPLLVAHDMSGSRLMDRRRRGCGKVGIPRLLRDFQAQWKTCLWFSTERLFHSLCPTIQFRFARPRPSLRVVTAHDVRPVPHAPGFIQMFAHRDGTSRQGSSPARRLNLKDCSSHHHGIVPVHHALLLHREHHLQILSPAGQKGRARLQGRHPKPSIELRHILFPQKLVRPLRRDDSPQPQLLRQPPLPGSESAFRPPARLRR